jgi:hypothetical protein
MEIDGKVPVTPVEVQAISVHHLNAFHVMPGDTDEENN